jgi:hypothetical protein
MLDILLILITKWATFWKGETTFGQPVRSPAKVMEMLRKEEREILGGTKG